MSGDEEDIDDGAGFLKDDEGKRIPRADMTAEQKNEDNRRRKLREKRKKNPNATMNEDEESELKRPRSDMTEEELEIIKGLKGKARSDMTEEERHLDNRHHKLRKSQSQKKMPEELTEEEILVVEGCKDTPKGELADEEKELLDRFYQLKRAKAAKRQEGGGGSVEMCGDFKRGDCSRGDSCRYSHGPGLGGGRGDRGGKGGGKGGKSEYLTIEQAQMFAEMMFWQGAEAATAKNAARKGQWQNKGKGSYGKDSWGNEGKGNYGKDSWGFEGKGNYGKDQGKGSYGKDQGKGNSGLDYGNSAFQDAWAAGTTQQGQDDWVAGEETRAAESVLLGGKGSIRNRLQQGVSPAPAVQASRLQGLFKTRGVSLPTGGF